MNEENKKEHDEQSRLDEAEGEEDNENNNFAPDDPDKEWDIEEDR